MATTTTNLNLTKPAGADYVDVNVLNNNFDTIDKLGVAYCLKSYTTTTSADLSFTWYVRTWSDGRCECYGTATWSGTPSLWWGGSDSDAHLYFNNLSYKLPVTFSGKPNQSLTVDGGNLFFSMIQGGSIHLVTPVSGTKFDGTISMQVMGRLA